jgi:hypothetical protein
MFSAMFVSKCFLFTYLLTYLLTPCSTVLLEKPAGLQLVNKFLTFYGTQRLNTAFTSARQLSLSLVSPIQSISHFLKINLNIILPSTPGSPQWSLSLRFSHQNPIHASLLSHPRYMPRPSHSPQFYHPHNSVSHTKNNAATYYHKRTQVFMGITVTLLIDPLHLNFLDRFEKKCSNIKFHENYSSGSRVLCRRTGRQRVMTKGKAHLCDFANAHKNKGGSHCIAGPVAQSV